MSKIKSIIIFIVAAAVLILIYVFLIKKTPEQDSLVSTSGTKTTTSATNTANPAGDPLGTKEFLTVLLSVKSIKLNDGIFSDVAFSTLRDSSIVLTADGTEGRANPFAPIGSDGIAFPTNNVNNANNTTTTAAPKPATPNAQTPPTVVSTPDSSN